MPKFKIVFCLAFVVAFTGCGKPGKTKVKNAEFPTLNKCLTGIEIDSGYALRIVTDKPGNVSGFLSNGQGFGCQIKRSGVKGIYYAGWYMYKDPNAR